MDSIISPNNEKVKMVSKLVKSAKERKYSGLYVIEGARIAQELPFENLDTIFLTQDFYDKYVETNDRLLRRVNYAEGRDRCYLVNDQVMKKLTDTETPQGFVATVKFREHSLEGLLGDGEEEPFILIVERLQDPGNMGTIIRAAEGGGVTGILVSYDSVDIYSPKVIRSTMGSIFRKKVAISYDLIRDVDKLRSHGVKVYAMHLDGSSMYETDLTGPVAFLIGNEGAGLSDEISSHTDKLIKIPMKGQVESLNAAISASLISYECMRQRSGNIPY